MARYLVIFFILLTNTVFSQTGDTIRTSPPPPPRDSIPPTPFDTNLIQNAYRMSSTSETYGIGTWIWNDRRNLGEILNEKPGFLVNFMFGGGRNTINFNTLDEKNIGIFKDGIQINDNLFGGFDIENISVNEIDTIEEISSVSSFLYGINSQTKAINIITKDVFQPQLFSQLRFSQDRYGSEYADVYFSQSLSRKFNWQIGATKHSIDGRYTNSDFDVWRGRGRINWFISPKANIRANINYASIQRGLNGGLIFSTQDTLENGEIAQVVNSDSYEKLTNYFYDLSFTGRFFRDRNSLTKIKLYSQNSLREYRDEENRANSNGIFISKNFHTVQYGLDVKQNFGINVSRDIKGGLLIGGNVYFNFFNYDPPFMGVDYVSSYKLNYYSVISRLDVSSKNISSSVMGKYERILGNSLLSVGVELGYNMINRKDFSLNIHGGLNIHHGGINYLSLQELYPGGISPFYNTEEGSYKELGFRLKYDIIYVNITQYNNSDIDNFDITNGNYEAGLLSKYIDIKAALNINSNRSFTENGATYYYTNIPKYFLKSDISYHDLLFKDNLNLRVGFNLKYINDLYTTSYNQVRYFASNTSIKESSAGNTFIDHLFNMDFYIGARIGSANINFTVANIFDNFNYDTFIFPWDDRGGALNSISRFTITWDFFN